MSEPVYHYGLPWAHVCEEDEIEFDVRSDGTLTLCIARHSTESCVDESEFMEVLEACG